MPHALIVSRPAADDIASAARWLRQPGSGQTASQRLKLIRRAITDLQFSPLMWPIGDHPGVRERPVRGYRILYTFAPSNTGSWGTVTVLRVFGPGQDRSDL
ncbi:MULTISPECIES: type II toxin-antitoxin system RelE/ParE family toxin [Methylorubrum]|uniref:Plasmid stabilization protain n=3 Tax=Alphaproteobacteria TaxID=28211 RepID=C5B6S5_METEA|nr:putative Plasmid stabilization protain [Methylorubrum extorquens AM1]MBD8907773.1 RelE/ParE family toxin [Methylorubrum zatmanii]